MKVELKISKPALKGLLYQVLGSSNFKDWPSIVKAEKLSGMLQEGKKDLKEGRFEFGKNTVTISDIELASFAKKVFEDFVKEKGIPGGSVEGVKELGELLGL